MARSSNPMWWTMKSTPRPSIHFAFSTRSSAAMLSPITLMPKSRPASTTRRIVASCARPMTTTRSAPAFAIISASRYPPSIVFRSATIGWSGNLCAEPLDRAQPLGEQKRRAGLEPVHAGVDADRRRLERFVERREIERELDDRVFQVIEIHPRVPNVPKVPAVPTAYVPTAGWTMPGAAPPHSRLGSCRTGRCHQKWRRPRTAAAPSTASTRSVP